MIIYTLKCASRSIYMYRRIPLLTHISTIRRAFLVLLLSRYKILLNIDINEWWCFPQSFVSLVFELTAVWRCPFSTKCHMCMYWMCTPAELMGSLSSRIDIHCMFLISIWYNIISKACQGSMNIKWNPFPGWSYS